MINYIVYAEGIDIKYAVSLAISYFCHLMKLYRKVAEAQTLCVAFQSLSCCSKNMFLCLVLICFQLCFWVLSSQLTQGKLGYVTLALILLNKTKQISVLFQFWLIKVIFLFFFDDLSGVWLDISLGINNFAQHDVSLTYFCISFLAFSIT